MDTVGFQGEPGAFSEEAALALLGSEIATQAIQPLKHVVTAVDRGAVPIRLLPCENTIYGQIAEAYDLLGSHPRIQIIDETTHSIEQCLIGLPNASIERLERVITHPVALEQRRMFLRQHPSLETEMVNDTAGAYGASSATVMRTVAAIVRRCRRNDTALRFFGLHQDDADNTTRFFLLGSTRRRDVRLGEACLA